MKKGFTLIELLAVIVILAIIALIAVPIILGIIGDTKKESNERSKELYLEAVKNAIAKKNLTEEFNPTTCEVKEDGNLTCDVGELIIEVNGKKPCSGEVTLDNGEIKSSNLSYCDGSDISQEDDKNKDTSGANAPELLEGLTPVKYENGNWVIADTSKEWYNYDAKEWANAVILKSELRDTKKAGDTLTLPTTNNDFDSSDVLAMLVWIPRYEYKMPENVSDKNNPGLIDIKFVSSSANTATDGYTLHPGFTFGDDTLSGIWVGKFETSHTTYSNQLKYNLLNCTTESCDEADNLRILPNVVSLRFNLVSKFFFVSRSMTREGNPFKLKSSTTDSHMMKNSEWGAVAYLSHSKYGKEDEVYINNCSSFITGIGADSASASSKSSCTNTYSTEIGQKASTTGNITGVYDMSGGSSEYVMGYLTTSSTDSAKFTEAPESKYYDEYIDTNKNNEAYKGQALGETSGWYSDNASFASDGFPWLYRGGSYSGTSRAGVFSSDSQTGDSLGGLSFRVVLVPTT